MSITYHKKYFLRKKFFWGGKAIKMAAHLAMSGPA